jgi:hypothetical protein
MTMVTFYLLLMEKYSTINKKDISSIALMMGNNKVKDSRGALLLSKILLYDG